MNLSSTRINTYTNLLHFRTTVFLLHVKAFLYFVNQKYDFNHNNIVIEYNFAISLLIHIHI